MATKECSGTSNKGDFAEALKTAIQTAQSDMPGTLVRWELKNVSGEFGGVTGISSVKVTIAYTQA